MSLLLDALKKAEKAKEEAKRQAGGADAGVAPLADGADEGNRHVVTRDDLPDISQSLKIASEDLSAAAVPRPAGPAPMAIELASEPPRRPPPGERAAAPAPQRAAAKNLFEAKFSEPNPKLPFYIMMGVLGVFAAGSVVYFWLQLRPPAPLVNPNPARAASERPGDSAALTRPAAPAAESQSGAPATQIPGVPGGTAQPAMAAPTQPASTGAIAPVATAPAASPAAPARLAPREPAIQARTAQALSADATRVRERPPVTALRAAPMVNPRLQQAYAAYNGGDFTAARAAYVDVLRDEPANRDALLGMAAVEIRAGRFEAADGYYARLLRADPRDPDAHAGRLALRSDQVDPVQAESRLKNLLAAEPGAHVLNFTLGNQYAQQGRWAEAQQAYFKAVSADAENPDYAYNLAVSLDQLRQPRLALEYYRRAIALAQARAASFDQGLARNRVQALSQAAR